jgi:type I restriction enzyme, S subunit
VANTVILVEICEPGGLQTGPFGSQLKAEEYTSEGIPVVMPKDILSGRVRIQGTAKISGEKAEKLKRHALRAGDIIFSRRGDLSKIGLITKGEDGIICGTGCLRARLRDSVSPDYVSYYLTSRTAVAWLEQNAVGQTMLNLNTKIVGQFPIKLPNYEEQCRIAQLLRRWDKAIELREQLIEAKEGRRRWLARNLLTGKRRLPGFDGRWRTVQLGNLFSNRVETGFPDLPLVAITNERGVVRRDELGRRDTSSDDKGGYLRIQPGDIGCNTMRMWQGVCGLSRIEGIVSPAYTVVTPTSELNGEFAAVLFKSPPAIHAFRRRSQGLVKDTLNLKWTQFAEIRMAIPPAAEQAAIVRVFEAADRELHLLHQQRLALQQQKNLLGDRLLTGKLRLKTIDRTGTETTGSNDDVLLP